MKITFVEFKGSSITGGAPVIGNNEMLGEVLSQYTLNGTTFFIVKHETIEQPQEMPYMQVQQGIKIERKLFHVPGTCIRNIIEEKPYPIQSVMQEMVRLSQEVQNYLEWIKDEQTIVGMQVIRDSLHTKSLIYCYENYTANLNSILNEVE